MIEQDTVKLLRECDAGVKMGVQSIDEVWDKAGAAGMRRALAENMRRYLRRQIGRPSGRPIA